MAWDTEQKMASVVSGWSREAIQELSAYKIIGRKERGIQFGPSGMIPRIL